MEDEARFKNGERRKPIISEGGQKVCRGALRAIVLVVKVLGDDAETVIRRRPKEAEKRETWTKKKVKLSRLDMFVAESEMGSYKQG